MEVEFVLLSADGPEYLLRKGGKFTLWEGNKHVADCIII